MQIKESEIQIVSVKTGGRKKCVIAGDLCGDTYECGGAVTIHTSAEGPSYPLNDSCTGAVVRCGWSWQVQSFSLLPSTAGVWDAIILGE